MAAAGEFGAPAARKSDDTAEKVQPAGTNVRCAIVCWRWSTTPNSARRKQRICP